MTFWLSFHCTTPTFGRKRFSSKNEENAVYEGRKIGQIHRDWEKLRPTEPHIPRLGISPAPKKTTPLPFSSSLRIHSTSAVLDGPLATNRIDWGFLPTGVWTFSHPVLTMVLFIVCHLHDYEHPSSVWCNFGRWPTVGPTWWMVWIITNKPHDISFVWDTLDKLVMISFSRYNLMLIQWTNLCCLPYWIILKFLFLHWSLLF